MEDKLKGGGRVEKDSGNVTLKKNTEDFFF